MKLKSFYVLATATILGGVLSSVAHAAGSAAFSLSPNSGSHVAGSSFTVQIHENGTDVNVVTAKLTYDPAKLTCNDVSAGSAAFPNTITATCGGGSVTISRYTTGTPANGDAIVGAINFTTIGNSGSTTVNFAPGSQIASNGNDTWNGATSGGTYTLTAPVVTTPTPGQGGGSTTSSPTTTTSGNSTTTNSQAATTANSKATSAVAGASTNQTATATDPVTGEKVSTAAKTAAAISDDSKSTSNMTAVWVSIGALVVLVAAAGVYWAKVLRHRKPAVTAPAMPKKLVAKAKKA